jgi:hypothetical protein
MLFPHNTWRSTHRFVRLFQTSVFFAAEFNSAARVETAGNTNSESADEAIITCLVAVTLVLSQQPRNQYLLQPP